MAAWDQGQAQVLPRLAAGEASLGACGSHSPIVARGATPSSPPSSISTRQGAFITAFASLVRSSGFGGPPFRSSGGPIRCTARGPSTRSRTCQELCLALLVVVA
jgi:hypothetical protein